VRLAAGLLAGVAACATAPPPDPTRVDDDDAILWFAARAVPLDDGAAGAAIRDAALWVDGRFVGTLEALRGGVAVEPGPHRFEIRHDDYMSHYAELTLAERQRERLTVELAPLLP
jgi:hypothetical protein